jgi:hypothetical protein
MTTSFKLIAAATAALIASPASAVTYWNVFNIEGEDSIGADIVWYDTFEDMLNDENRAGTGQTDGFGGGFNANIVGAGSDGDKYWNVFNIEEENNIGADLVWYNTFDDMLNDENRAGTGQTNGFGGGFNANIVGAGSDGDKYWNVFNIEGEDSIGADIVWYDTFDDMLNDENRAGTGQTNEFGGGFNANIVGSGSDGENYWNVFNIEGEDNIGADIVWYATFQDMLNDENRQGTGQTNGFGGGFNANIVGSGASLISFMPPPADDPIPPVPVPASLPLLLAGLGGLTLLRKRRKA